MNRKSPKPSTLLQRRQTSQATQPQPLTPAKPMKLAEASAMTKPLRPTSAERPENRAVGARSKRTGGNRPPKAKAERGRKLRLVNNQRRRTFLTWTRVLRYGLRNFTRNAWLTVAATVVMVITLLIIMVAGVATSILDETITSQKDKMDISLYFKSDTPDKTLNEMASKLRQQPNVTNVSVSTSQQEYDKFRKSSSQINDAISFAMDNGGEVNLSSVLHVKLADFNKKDELTKYVKSTEPFKTWQDTSRNNDDDITIRQNTVDKLSSIMDYAGKAGIVAGAIFVVISILIIFNTIRMTIFSRRDEIAMMKAIGADSYFIRGPFLIEAELYGVIAAVVAMVLGYLALRGVLPSLGGYIEVAKTQALVNHWWWAILLGLMLIGFIIGDLSARLALHRYLKKSDY